MSAAPDPPAPPKPPEPAWREFARAPLVPVAVAATVGLVADRYGPVPWTGSVFGGIAALVAWLVARPRQPDAARIWLWFAAAALAAAHHHAHRHAFAADDIGHAAPAHPTPARLRGMLDEEPVRSHTAAPDPLRTLPRPATTVTVLLVTAIDTRDGWQPASGRARLTIEGVPDGLHIGDEVEVAGRLSRPETPANPGEWDERSRLLDQRITAVLHTRRGPDGITRLREGWRSSLFGWLAVARGWGTRTLQAALPSKEAAVAAALLLGDTAAMDRAEWDVYVRTGVVHVLAISGQHLVVLAVFVWTVLRVAGVRRRHGAWAVAAVMIGYTLLTGARPSAVRAAVMVCVVCGGIVLLRPVIPANAFALAWLVVLAVNPADPFTAGCQLSFLSVFVLVWFAGPLLAPRPLSPVEQLIEESRTLAGKVGRFLLRATGAAFAVSLVLGVVNAPLILAWQNIAAPVGVVLGPPLVLLTSVALIAGFLLLLVSPLGSWAGWPLAKVTAGSLAACDGLVRVATRIPGGWVYAPGPAAWWLTGFYAGVAAVVLLAGRWRLRAAAGLAMWVLVGLVLGSNRTTDDELRVTFLAVGDGGCVVIETPDGRVFLYDAGTMTGPDVVRRTVAPFLWSRGIARIDEVFLSHADLDHFNGIPDFFKTQLRSRTHPPVVSPGRPGRWSGIIGATGSGGRHDGTWAVGCEPGLPMDYDDDLELTRYIWDHYPALMTEFERRVGQAIIGRLKAANAGAPPSHPLWTRWGAAGDPDVEAALADGPEAYRRRVRIRVLAEAGDKAFVNRCPSCGRVVRTPTARQCFWCGHDWH